jgi:hypothetical protein
VIIVLEQFLTPEKFGEMLCEDLELPSYKFTPLIAESIRAQVLDFESIHEVEIPDDGMRVVINVRKDILENDQFAKMYAEFY